MTRRDNLLRMYRRQGYEHAPVEFGLCPSLQEQYRQRAGNQSFEEYFSYPEGFGMQWIPWPHWKPREPVDYTRYYDTPLKPGTCVDDYGVAHEPGSEAAQHMTYMRHPLGRATSAEELLAYPLPETDTENIEHIRKAVAEAHADGRAAFAGMACTVWETAWYIRDMTQLMMDMTLEDEKATIMLDRITNEACNRIGVFATAGVDIVELGDDIGMQSTIMMSEEMYRTWLQPRLAQVIATAKRIKPDILIKYHTCGYVEPLIPNLIEAGIDILNPVQPECMSFDRIHKKFGRQLSFNGTLGTQTTMPFGTPKDVRAAVLKNLELAGPAGGLFCCPTHLLEPEVPWENVEAYVRACKEFKAAGG